MSFSMAPSQQLMGSIPAWSLQYSHQGICPFHSLWVFFWLVSWSPSTQSRRFQFSTLDVAGEKWVFLTPIHTAGDPGHSSTFPFLHSWNHGLKGTHFTLTHPDLERGDVGKVKLFLLPTSVHENSWLLFFFSPMKCWNFSLETWTKALLPVGNFPSQCSLGTPTQWLIRSGTSS